MYKILHIPTGLWICYFDPKPIIQKAYAVKPHKRNKNYLYYKSQYRRPPTFYVEFATHRPDDLYIPEWVIWSITHNKKMKRRLLDSLSISFECEKINHPKPSCIEEFDFILQH